jgi:hypothetical protein
MAGIIGAVSGTVLVVFLATVTWAIVQDYYWVVMAPVMGGMIGAMTGKRLCGTDAAVSGSIGGTMGSLIGAFLAVASAEIYRGGEWALYGGLYGAAAAAICGAVIGSIDAARRGIIAHFLDQNRPNRTGSCLHSGR